ncbi:SRPBCC domain-containing protein [Leucobacter sp. CSA1]|uniref:SRPBCC domain-containing protein n=1 Tax=Leucobacter chromiisoli TaxID=2796471 RepID=A0A934QB39_9MICO|nr:SRPBCC family protein [Leucobacter chromiisoli]MBK0419919.1 SRPBCC domain-containing protein [Leucobacter chromiisoli]
MPITAVNTDPEALTLTVVADFTVPVRRLWDAYLDPRQIERFWGPPEYPATFLRHDAFPGGLTNYYMTGPEGDRSHGYWEWVAVDEPRAFEVRDGFSHDDGTPNAEMPSMRMVFEFAETALGSRLTTTTHFSSLEELEQLQGMGMVEGMSAAMGQIDAVVEDLASFAAGRGTELQLIGENQARTSRIVRGTVEQVWRAHHDPDLLRRWQLGPDGWTMPICEVGTEPGQRHRSGWENSADGQRFGFTGVVQEIAPPHRSVSTEAMWTLEDPDAANSPETINELTLTPVEGGTLVSLLITYPDSATREMILSTGMVDGMEASYARLENEVIAA